MSECVTNPDAAVINIGRLGDYDPIWVDKESHGHD